MRRSAELAMLMMILSAAVLSAAAGCGLAWAAEDKSQAKVVINGSGATFPMPVYHEWAKAYEQKKGKKNVQISYRGIGSSGGIAHIKAKTVDFGGSDKPLSSKELDDAGLIQFPMIMGGVVPVIHVEGIRQGKLKLTPELLVDIFLGKIKKWNDRRILAVNPELRVPGDDITVVHRADGSGTTWIFTSYLSKVSNIWKEKVGSGNSVPWPTGLGGKGNPGVAKLVGKTPGAIGYVEFTYAVKNKLTYVQLQNLAGKFVSPQIGTFQSAAENADWEGSEGFSVNLNDQPGEKTWPILGTSYIVVYKNQPDAEKSQAMLDFFDWCFNNGEWSARKLDYVPMPKNVVKLVHTLWKKSVVAGGKDETPAVIEKPAVGEKTDKPMVSEKSAAGGDADKPVAADKPAADK
ncbi:MAG: phosphate ABC transporter substrate-binding protein PstS [Pseudomonadota bacterium]